MSKSGIVDFDRVDDDRRAEAEALLIAIGDFIDAKLAESRGFAKYNMVTDAKVKLFNQLMAVI